MDILVIKLSPLRGVTSSMMRAIGLVKGLCSLGHEVDMLTTPEASQLIALRETNPLKGVAVRQLQTASNAVYSKLVSSGKRGFKRRTVNLLRKMYHAFSLYDNTIRIAKTIGTKDLKSRYDLVISVSDPKSSHVAVQQLKELGLQVERWVQYWGDPMTLDITNKSILPRFLYRREERRLLSGCDKVFYTNPFTLEKQRNLFPEFAGKMVSTPTALSNELICAHQPGGPFRISYIGAYHSRVRDILPFYQAALSLGEGKEVFIVGDSDHVLSGSDNVRVLPRGEVDEIERGTDLFICVLNRTGTQIPGKVYHYAASNRPILVILDGEERTRMKDYLAGFNRYLFCENRVEDIRDAIQAISSSTQQWYPSDRLSPRRVAESFLK